ncbi:hypothetical protein C4K04_3213 [Pseudomonas chlororaphis]|uniref:Uncharacterized protein n=1 Tax=Pseudomonas chlororaphis TaxID=587753 RepID=A0A3G7TP20_9PSED|nr:hypothetical protein C4K04_3213 [Pseudomonas chlororaphis]
MRENDGREYRRARAPHQQIFRLFTIFVHFRYKCWKARFCWSKQLFNNQAHDN